MATKKDANLTRRELLKIGAMTGAAAVVGGAAVRPAPVAAQTFPSCGLPPVPEPYPTSPLILRPLTDPLPIPRALGPVDPQIVAKWTNKPGSGIGQQDSSGGTHQLWTSQLPAPYDKDPLVYQIKL